MEHHEAMLLTVGEMAKLTGTSVRTLQFYDQKGLLSPAVKDQSNRRLYKIEQVESIRRIQSLKYLGLSLDDIKKADGKFNTSDDLRRLVESEALLIEDQLNKLLRRSCVLQALKDMTNAQNAGEPNTDETAKTDNAPVNWSAVLNTIETTETTDPATPEKHAADKQPGGLMNEWHGIVAQAIGLINARINPTAPEARKLAVNFIELNRKYGSKELNAHLNNLNDNGAFGKLRGNIYAYLKHAVAAYLKNTKSGQ